MKLTIKPKRVVDTEPQTIGEWFAITEYGFKIVSWLLMLGVLAGLANKTHSIILVCVEGVLWVMLVKLFAKACLLTVHAQVVGLDHRPKLVTALNVALSILLTLPVLFAFNWFVNDLLKAFSILQ